MAMRDVKIAGVGSYAPEKILTNHDLESIVDTTDEWITTRTGIKERHIAADSEASSDLGIKAAEEAIKNAGVSPKDIDVIITATITPDYIYPSTAGIIQVAIGAEKAFCFDIEAACSGFIYAITMGSQFIASGRYDTVLVIAPEVLSRVTDWEDRGTCVLFGDGAGAAVLTVGDDNSKILSGYLGCAGEYADLLKLPAGGCLNPTTKETVENRMHYMKMEGQEVFKAAVNAMRTAGETVMANAKLTSDMVSLVIPHQANMRIIKSVAKFMGVSMDKVYTNLDRYGNTSSASIGLALSEALKEGKVSRGDIIVLVAFGGGFTWGSLAFKY